MSNTYLDKFRSSLSTTQGNQILRLLISKRDSGEIKNVNEFKDRLKQLTAEILAERITPTLKLFKAIPGEDISSAQFNEMLNRIEDDLETAFVEADNIDEIIAAHHNLINEVSLKALRFAINELESKTTLYEFLQKSNRGFDDSIFNTFRESINHITSRADSASALVYIDPLKSETIPVGQDAEVDLVGERLILGPQQKQYLTAKEALWLSNENSIRSELNVAFQNSNINHIVDNENNTYWVEPILLRSIRTSGAPMEVSIGLNASQDVNFVEIEPATNFPMVLVGIDYFDANNTRRSTTVSEITLRGPTRVNFGRINTKYLIIRVRQDNYREIQFRKKQGEPNFHKAVLGQSSDTVDIDAINEDLRELLTSDFILTNVMSLPAVSTDSLKYYEYILGFDNIRAGYNTFQDRSVYISEVKKVSKPGQVAVRVEETRPYLEAGYSTILTETHTYPVRSTTADNKFYHGSIEYWLIAQFFTEDNFLISTDAIPLLPLGANRIYHEQLYFRDTTSSASKPDVAQLRFYCAADSSDVLIYRNGTLLNYSSDWSFIESDDADVGSNTITTANTGKPMKRAIKILNTVQPLDIYTVSYTPLTSNTQVVPPSGTPRMRVIDLLGDNSARMITDNVVVFENTRLAYNIDYALFYFMVLMRRNSALEHYTPALEEYMVITGSKDTTKFSGD